jgi:hypothetical protein
VCFTVGSFLAAMNVRNIRSISFAAASGVANGRSCLDFACEIGLKIPIPDGSVERVQEPHTDAKLKIGLWRSWDKDRNKRLARIAASGAPEPAIESFDDRCDVVNAETVNPIRGVKPAR